MAGAAGRDVLDATNDEIGLDAVTRHAIADQEPAHRARAYRRAPRAAYRYR